MELRTTLGPVLEVRANISYRPGGSLLNYRVLDMYDALRPAPVQVQPTGWGGQTYMGYQR